MQLEQWISEEVRAARGPQTTFWQRVVKMDFKSQVMLVGSGLIVIAIFWPLIKLLPGLFQFLGTIVVTVLFQGGTKALSQDQLSNLFLLVFFVVLSFILFKFRVFLGKLMRGERWSDEGKLKALLKRIREEIPDTERPRPEDLALAATHLRNFQPMNPAQVEAVQHEPWLRWLVLSRAVDIDRSKLRKVVSIKSIEQDREAGWDEE